MKFLASYRTINVNLEMGKIDYCFNHESIGDILESRKMALKWVLGTKCDNNFLLDLNHNDFFLVFVTSAIFWFLFNIFL